MKIELHYDVETGVTINAVETDAATEWTRTVCTGTGETLAAAVKSLVSKFAEMQTATIEALNASGLVHYVKTDVGGLS